MDTIDSDQLRQSTWVRHVEHWAEIDSTNDYAIKVLREIPADRLPALVVADTQTAGRGRGANRWWMAAGGLPFSVIVEPTDDAAAQASGLSLAVGLAVARGLQEFVEPSRVQLKWPNDVYVDERKVSGVLVEQPAGKPVRWVIGVGINVNNSIADAPDELRQRAVSLSDATGRPHSRQQVLCRVLDQLQRHLDWLSIGAHQLADDWRELCLLTGKWVELDVYGGRVSGYCEGIDDEGGLLLRTAAGPQRFVGGVVAHFTRR
ncbi:MAG: biotin--[acetyl-CoA-carboxylase] ligase [Pirellulales bacterium]